MTIDYEDLDPGIRGLVRWLRDRDFETVDSGDGVSKEGVYDDFLPFPHVAMLTTPEKLVTESWRLKALLEAHGITFEAKDPETDPHIDASYSPIDGHAVLMLSNVDDKLMGLI